MKKTLFILLALLPTTIFAQKFGHINSQELFALMPEMKAVKQKLDTLQSSYENQLVGMQEEFNKKLQDFQQNQATMTDGVKEFRQQELAEMEQRVQLFLQTAQQDIKKKQEEYLQPIQEKMNKAIKAVGERGGFTYIFESGTLHYISNDAIDLMSEVKKELNIK